MIDRLTKEEKLISMDALCKAVDLLGNQRRLALKVGISSSAVTCWFQKNKIPTLSTAIKIERATEGKVTRKDIRPDIDW